MFFNPKGRTMKKLFLLLLFSLPVCAEEVTYGLEENGNAAGVVTLVYSEHGYTIKGETGLLSFEQSEHSVFFSFGKEYFAMPVFGRYYHRSLGVSYGSPVNIGNKPKDNSVGWHSILYIADTTSGRLYHEEFSYGQTPTFVDTFVDAKDQIIMMQITKGDRFFSIARLPTM